MNIGRLKGKNFFRIALLSVAVVIIIAAAVWSGNPLRLPFTRGLALASPAALTASALSGVNGSALKGQGDLAFVRDGLLYVVAGKTGQVTRVSESGQALKPLWSHDGQWLAYLRSGDDANRGILWLVRRDGTQAHEIQGLPQVVMKNGYAWSPSGNRLAVSCLGIWLVGEQGQARQMVPKAAASPWLAWSSDGKHLAYSVTPAAAGNEGETPSDVLYSLDTATGKTARLLTAPAAGIHIASWRPDNKGILYWELPMHSASLASDGVALMNLDLGSRQPVALGTGLTYREWLCLGPGGRFLQVAGGPRIAWTDKYLALGDVSTGVEKKFTNPQGTVSVDPALSPDNRQIAFVAARDLGAEVWGFSQPGELQKWINSRALWLVNVDGSGARSLPNAGPGVYQPEWSGDGKYIMYVADDSVWIIDSQGQKRQKLVGGFPRLQADDDFHFGFYGFVNYHDFLAWHKA